VEVARMWWPQCGQTLRLAARSRWKIICWQAGHWCHRFSGTADRVNRVRILGRTYSVSQLMREWIALDRGPGKLPSQGVHMRRAREVWYSARAFFHGGASWLGINVISDCEMRTAPGVAR